MELLHIECLGRPLRLIGNMAGWQQLFWNNQLVAEKNAGLDNEGPFAHEFELRFPVENSENIQVVHVRLEGDLKWEPFELQYRLFINRELALTSKRDVNDIARAVEAGAGDSTKKVSTIGILSLVFKLFKSAKVIKVLLAGAGVAAYTWLFSFQFALALISCLVIHEYGHIRAMKYFGLKTKGIYIIPFVGGLALSDDKISTRWQDVVISMAGPIFGLLLSLALLVVYWVTDWMFFAALANFNALINLFNLLPILPLDGGHVIKSISFSIHSRVGLIIMCVATLVGVLIAYTFNLFFLMFFMIVGAIEISSEWRLRHESPLLPLNKKAMIASAIIYLVTVVSLVLIMTYFYLSGDPLLSTPLKILQS